jgi:hypothetical protein
MPGTALVGAERPRLRGAPRRGRGGAAGDQHGAGPSWRRSRPKRGVEDGGHRAGQAAELHADAGDALGEVGSGPALRPDSSQQQVGGAEVAVVERDGDQGGIDGHGVVHVELGGPRGARSRASSHRAGRAPCAAFRWGRSRRSPDAGCRCMLRSPKDVIGSTLDGGGAGGHRHHPLARSMCSTRSSIGQDLPGTAVHVVLLVEADHRREGEGDRRRGQARPRLRGDRRAGRSDRSWRSWIAPVSVT